LKTEDRTSKAFISLGMPAKMASWLRMGFELSNSMPQNQRRVVESRSRQTVNTGRF